VTLKQSIDTNSLRTRMTCEHSKKGTRIFSHSFFFV